MPFFGFFLVFGLGLSVSALGAAGEGQGRRLVFGGDANFPPYEFIDKRGQAAGLNVDLIRAVAKERGFELEIRLLPWGEIVAAMDRAEIDLAAMYRFESRLQRYEFGIPHELVYHEMYIRKGEPGPRVLEDLRGKRILVEAETYSEDALSALGFGDNLVRCGSEPEALLALSRGTGDVAVVTQTVGRPFDRPTGGGAEIVTTGSPVLLSEYAFVTQKGRRDLIEEINEGVVAVKASGEYERIYDRWVRPGRAVSRWVGILVWGLGGACVVVVWFLLWNWALRRRVALQTRALRREFEERERAQAALESHERRLRQAQKMETVGRLAGGVAHDFNNILTVILNYAGFLREDLVAAGRPTGDLDEIIAASERAAALTRRMLMFSRETPVKVARLDLCVVLREIAGMIRRLVGEDVVVETTVDDVPVVADIDRTGIEQALLNLAANARDAMDGQGRLGVVVGARTLPAGHPSGLAPGEYACISVSDSGCGMDEHTLAHIAEPFFTTKEPGKGTGLGLASVFATVEKLRGKVLVRSEVGRGSVFEILLPRMPSEGLDAGPVAPTGTIRRVGEGKAVLLVEDDESLRRAACIALKRARFDVAEARDGEHALEMAMAGARFDVLVTDVVMPRMSGPQLAQELRQRLGSLSVLFISGYVRKESGLDLSLPGSSFLPKPYSAEQLVETVEDLLRGNGTKTRPVPRLVR